MWKESVVVEFDHSCQLVGCPDWGRAHPPERVESGGGPGGVVVAGRGADGGRARGRNLGGPRPWPYGGWEEGLNIMIFNAFLCFGEHHV